MRAPNVSFPGKMFVVVVMDSGIKMAYEMANDARGELEEVVNEEFFHDYHALSTFPSSELRLRLEGRVVQGKVWKPGDDFIPTDQPSLRGPRGELEG